MVVPVKTLKTAGFWKPRVLLPGNQTAGLSFLVILLPLYLSFWLVFSKVLGAKLKVLRFFS